MARPRWGCGMERKLIRLIVASVLMLVGCGGKGGDGTLEVTENGTYDVSGYSQVVVHVGDEGQDGEEAPVISDQALVLDRVQFKGLSMDVPTEMVEGYTAQELTENDNVLLHMPDEVTSLGCSCMDLQGLQQDVADYNDGPQEDVNGITMAVKHEHVGSSRSIRVDFIYNDSLYSISFYYPVERDDYYSDYAEEFYRTIQMN